MSNSRDVTPINSSKGMSVLSLATGNKLGRVEELYIDPVTGLFCGISLSATGDPLQAIAYEQIYSFGRDAIMVKENAFPTPLEGASFQDGRRVGELFGTKIISESGVVHGEIANILVTLDPPPVVVYEVRQSLLDKLLGRGFYMLASAGHALSEDSERLIVPEAAIRNAGPDINEILGRTTTVVRSFASVDEFPLEAEDETILRTKDEDETVVRLRRGGDDDDDDTVVRMPRKAS